MDRRTRPSSPGAGKDPNSLTQWAWKDQAGGLPDKDNLQDAFAAVLDPRERIVSGGGNGDQL